MKLFNKVMILVAIAFCVSCEDKFLDLDPLDSVTETVYFKTPEHFEYASNNLYNQLIGWSSVRADASLDRTAYGDFLDFGSDLTALAQLEGQGGNGSVITDAYWDNPYFWLRDDNILLQKAAEYEGDPTEISEYVATAYFFRAWNHFLLMQRFGGVPIVNEVLDLTSDQVFGTRNSRYEVFAQVLSDVDMAIEGLPLATSIGSADIGKISSDAAKAFKARALLYEATWEMNVGTTTDGDGITTGAGSAKPEGYPSTTAMLTESNTLAKDVMDNGGYTLWNHNTELQDSSMFYLFNLEDAGSNPAGLDKSSNNEFIIQGIYDFVLRQGGSTISHTVGGRISPSRKMMDMFLCTDGLPIDKSPLFNGYNTVWGEMQNRDFRMRSYFDGVPENSSPVLNSQPSISNPGNGVQGRKFEAYDFPNYRQDNQESQNFPNLRLAEVYLIYAETLMELNGVISDEELDVSINLIRERAGIAPLTNLLVLSNGLDLEEEIKRERAIELFAENSRFHDLKRWGIAIEALGEPILGPVIEGTEYEGNPTLYDVDSYPEGEMDVLTGSGILRAIIIDPIANRNFALKHYLAPIPQGQIQLNTSLVQNPGW